MPSQDMQPVSNLYKGGFFKNRHKMMWRVPIFCDAVLHVFDPRSVVDVGCAIGDFVQGFAERGLISVGIEGSEASKPFWVTQSIMLHDLRTPLPLNLTNQTFDLCMSLEVAEHIEEEFSDTYVETLCRLSTKVLISAAPPGQKGHHHVNCQNIEYWDYLFKMFSYRRNDAPAKRVIESLSPYKNKAGIKAYCENLHFYEFMRGYSYD